MTEVINIVNTNIIAQITADDGTVVQTNCQPKIVKLSVKWLQISNTDKPVEFTIFYKLGVKMISD
jgi:hypothetical protein